MRKLAGPIALLIVFSPVLLMVKPIPVWVMIAAAGIAAALLTLLCLALIIFNEPKVSKRRGTPRTEPSRAIETWPGIIRPARSQ